MTEDFEEDFSWLEPEEPKPRREVAAHGTAKALAREGKRPAQLIAAERKLNLMQRTYLVAFQEAGFIRSEALRILKIRGLEPHRVTIHRWFQQPAFLKALDLRMAYAVTQQGLDKLSVLHKVNAIGDHALERVVKYDKEGNVIDESFRDLRGALKAMELLGKNQKLWSDEDSGPKITVGIELVDWTKPRGETIEADEVS